MPELGAVGFATVVANEPTPDIVDGPGQVVTATFRHDSAKVLDLTFSPTGKFSADSRLFPSGQPQTNLSVYSLKSQASSQSFGVTSAHPFWSVTRDEFVPAGDLEYGEQVVTIDGQLWHLTTITPRAGPETVYNFEVAHEHVYYVGSDGLLVHNSYLVDKLRSLRDFTVATYSRIARKVEAIRRARRLRQNSANTIVTSYARRTPDLTSRRWVQLGKRSLWNYIKTGLWGPKIFPAAWGKSYNSVNSITRLVPKSSLRRPGISDGLFEWFKGFFGQRLIK